MKEILICVVLVLALPLAGWWWAHGRNGLARWYAWSALLVATALTAALTHEWGSIGRMIALCCVLLAGMKGLVYVEWSAGRRSLQGWPFWAFSFLWFGMDPGAFARRRPGLEWRSHLRTGVACVLFGSGASLLVRSADWTTFLLVFVPMSVGFHFGILRMLTAGWRKVGFPVRPLFRNPLRSANLADFWAKRWNLGYSQMMVRVVLRPLEPRLGKAGAIMAVFLVSGLLHELAITLPVRSGYGGPTLYFVLQGIAVRLGWLPGIVRIPRIWALLWVIVPLGLLFPTPFREEVIIPCLQVLPDLGGLIAPTHSS